MYICKSLSKIPFPQKKHDHCHIRLKEIKCFEQAQKQKLWKLLHYVTHLIKFNPCLKKFIVVLIALKGFDNTNLFGIHAKLNKGIK